MKNIASLFIVIFLLCISGIAQAQTFTIKAQIKNFPQGNIVFGYIQGDEFTALDTAVLNQSFGLVEFEFPPNAHPGVYRINMGKSAAARVLNEPPQTFDVIFDNENIAIETDFKAPVKNLRVMESKENAAWYEFLAKDEIIRQSIELVEKEINSNWQKGDTAKVVELATEFNQLQMERDMFVTEWTNKTRGLFASQMIKNLRVPILDGYLTSDERKESFKKEFFRTLDFSDPALINSAIYTDNLFKYLVMFNRYDYTEKKREEEYKKALDNIVPNIKQNDEVYRFLMDYLTHGFNVLRMPNIITYISDKYNYPE